MANRSFLGEHLELSRRYFARLGLAGLVSAATFGRAAAATAQSKEAKPRAKAGAVGEPYFTPQSDFQDVSRGKPVPHGLPDDRKRAVGLTPETWKLEVLSDPDFPSRLGRELTNAAGTALDFGAFLKLGEGKSVRFAKVMTCLNLGCPLGMGLWEGVPLRDVIALTKPRENLRRVHYHGFHNDDPKQIFRSSLPIGRVLEDPFDLPPVILCYKLNGEWLDAKRGGPVRVVVPEAYGFKSIKWLSRVYLSNIAHANDTYGEQNNDVDSPLKTFAASLSVPSEVKAGQPIPVSGYAQVGISGLSKVQVSIEREGVARADDPYFTQAPWVDADLLPPPKRWNSLPDGRIPAGTHGFNVEGRPLTWPMRLTNAHWAAVLPELPVGDYVFRSRSIDEKGQAQPLPRPFRKSGHSAIESVTISVKG